MKAKLRQTARKTIEKIHADMKTDAALRQAAKDNPVRVLADRGLKLDDIIAAYDAEDWCPQGSTTNPCKPVSIG
jgi:hypothetical protein